MRRKTWLRIILVLSVMAVVMCGTVLALMFRQTERIDNQFEPARVDCVVHEKLDGSGDYTEGLQNAQTKTSIRVENTGNIEAYIRVRFVSYWVNANGNIVGKPSSMPQVTCTSDWIADGDTYYYKRPVAPGAFTEELLEAGAPITLASQDSYIQVVEVFADAIQSVPAAAAQTSWGVEIFGGQIQSVTP